MTTTLAPRLGHVLVPRLALAAIAGGAGMVLLLWLHDTPATLHGLGDYLTNAGRITGLLAGYAIVVLLLLMGRLPPLERWVGADRLARWHGFGGRYTVSLIVAHTLLITWGYAVTAHTAPTSEAVTLLRSYPDVLMATVAAGLFVGVGVVSARAVRARVRYETWYYLHFYTYLAAGLAFAHQFATGADFMTNRPARVLWSLLYGGTAALLLWYRFVVPVRRAVRHRMRVYAVRREGRGVVSILITGHYLDELRAEPGQFFRWRFLTREGWWQSHPYSLSAPPHHSYLRITVKALGDHTSSLRLLRPGTRVLAEGPYGALTADRRSRRRVLLLAGGIGITPLRALFETMPAGAGELALFYRANTERELIFRSELEQIADARGATVSYLIGPPGGPRDPLTPARLYALLPDVARRDVFVSGPPAMVSAAMTVLRDAGVPLHRIHHESFGL